VDSIKSIRLRRFFTEAESVNSNLWKISVVLVDAADNVLGTMGKMEAHREGALHRADVGFHPELEREKCFHRSEL
jgi:hypothetical protein